MEIIQFEEYSEDIDFDEIRRYDIQKKIGELHRKVNLRKGRQMQSEESCEEKPKQCHCKPKPKHCKKKGKPPGFDLDHIKNAGKKKKKQVKT